MTAAMMTASAGAITQDGQSETWFDGVWALIDAFGLKAEHDPYVLQNYINKYLEKHPDEMYDVLNDILSLLDTHSMYLSSEEYSQGFSTLEGFVGIGVGLQETENGVQIAEVMRYSAAEEAGLQIGDLIVKINGEDATGLKNADVASKLRGEEGTSVKLTVRRYGRDITVTCERRQVNRVYVSNKTMADGVEYIKVSAIGSQNDWSAFSEIWDSLPSKNTRAVILDLRGNGGGLIDAALKMANVMTPVKDAELAGVRYRDDMGGLEQTYSTGNALPLNKIVVLVDGGTASAAELLAGSLQDTGSATLIGSKTYGSLNFILSSCCTTNLIIKSCFGGNIAFLDIHSSYLTVGFNNLNGDMITSSNSILTDRSIEFSDFLTDTSISKCSNLISNFLAVYKRLLST